MKKWVSTPNRPSAPSDADSGVPELAALGPRAAPLHFSCAGCSALKAEWWKDHLDNDETDSGTLAKCAASNDKAISAYWSERMAPPQWCPAIWKYELREVDDAQANAI